METIKIVIEIVEGEGAKPVVLAPYEAAAALGAYGYVVAAVEVVPLPHAPTAAA